MSVELPKKHGRGGQSALRFARLRLEKRHNYVTKVAEMAAQVFITNDKVNVVGLVVAGSAEFKTVLVEAERFDQRLAAKVIGVYDVSYGGENGLNQVSLSCAGTLWVPCSPRRRGLLPMSRASLPSLARPGQEQAVCAVRATARRGRR